MSSFKWIKDLNYGVASDDDVVQDSTAAAFHDDNTDMSEDSVYKVIQGKGS